ncbi:hypothetical protein Tco_1040993 [Tanacetum coccineum]|uniref:Uncharacterized protein n=1 Tax=Tanacetum coccineum TaxID=301880 RepID=A0ABQ5GG02_9ASTR
MYCPNWILDFQCYMTTSEHHEISEEYGIPFAVGVGLDGSNITLKRGERRVTVGMEQAVNVITDPKKDVAEAKSRRNATFNQKKHATNKFKLATKKFFDHGRLFSIKSYYALLQDMGTSVETVKKPEDVEINTCNGLIKYAKENLRIKGLKEAQVYEICKAAQLVDTAYAKKQHFVFVDNLAKGVTEDLFIVVSGEISSYPIHIAYELSHIERAFQSVDF